MLSVRLVERDGSVRNAGYAEFPYGRCDTLLLKIDNCCPRSHRSLYVAHTVGVHHATTSEVNCFSGAPECRIRNPYNNRNETVSLSPCTLPPWSGRHRSELEQFTVDTGRTPERVCDAHLVNKLTNLSSGSWPTAP